LNEAKQYHAAILASFDFQSKKEDSETKVGNAMNLEEVPKSRWRSPS
jgi:hypothetical protein